MSGKTIAGVLSGLFWGASLSILLVALASQQMERRSIDPVPGAVAPVPDVAAEDTPDTAPAKPDSGGADPAEGAEAEGAEADPVSPPDAASPVPPLQDPAQPGSPGTEVVDLTLGSDPSDTAADNGTSPQAPETPDVPETAPTPGTGTDGPPVTQSTEPAPGVQDEPPDRAPALPGRTTSNTPGSNTPGAAPPGRPAPGTPVGGADTAPPDPLPDAPVAQTEAPEAGAAVPDETAPPMAFDTAGANAPAVSAPARPGVADIPEQPVVRDTAPPPGAPALLSDAPRGATAMPETAATPPRPTVDTPATSAEAPPTPVASPDDPALSPVEPVPSAPSVGGTPGLAPPVDLASADQTPRAAQDPGVASASAPMAPARSPAPDAPPRAVEGAPTPLPGGRIAGADGIAPNAPDTPEVITDRLPRIGDPESDPQDAMGANAAPNDTADPRADVAEAILRNGEPFDNASGKPIVAVVLLDDGGPLVDLPLQVSVALDPTQEGAAARASAYRDAGVEVLMITTLPPGATASDAAVTMESHRATFGQAMAVMDTEDGALQSNRDAIAEIARQLADSGHGFVSFPKGLNSGFQQVQREDVPSGLVFRQIDAEGQDTRAVKRFLDQAAFRARQEDAVILVGRNRPETTAALVEWTLGNRAASVSLAPVSAALLSLSP